MGIFALQGGEDVKHGTTVTQAGHIAGEVRLEHPYPIVLTGDGDDIDRPPAGLTPATPCTMLPMPIPKATLAVGTSTEMALRLRPIW